MSWSRLTIGATLVSALLGLMIACGEHEPHVADGGADGGADAGGQCTAYDMCVSYVSSCGGGDNELDDCEKGFSGTDCTMTQEMCAGIVAAWGDCDAVLVYMGPYEAGYIGGSVTASCDEFCARCEACHDAYPEMVEEDCGDYSSAASSSCLTGCEADTELMAKLADLAVPLSDFGCCQLDYFF